MNDKEYLSEIVRISKCDVEEEKIVTLDELNKKYKPKPLEAPIESNPKNNGKSPDWGCLPGYRRDKRYAQVR